MNFRAENVHSYRDEFEFSLEATSIAEPDCVHEVPWREGGSPMKVLPAAGVFGANASGKTKLLEAMWDMSHHVMDSFRQGGLGDPIPRSPFSLDDHSGSRPSRYEVDFILGGVWHTYGFVLDSERVHEEWSYRRPKGRSALMFHRDGDTIEFGALDKARSRAARDLLRPNALYLSTAAAAGHPQLSMLSRWFFENFSYAETASRPWRQLVSRRMLDNSRDRSAVLTMLWAADLGISDVRERVPAPQAQEMLQQIASQLSETGWTPFAENFLLDDLATINFVHTGSTGEYELEASQESRGTLEWFDLVGPVLEALAKGSLLLVDELDTSLHPDLTRLLVRFFQNRETNPRLAQLVFNSHDLTLMGDSIDARLLGRDQIWFTEKLHDGSSRLYPLSDLGPRKNEAVAKRYREGYYGARPILMEGALEGAAKQAMSSAP